MEEKLFRCSFIVSLKDLTDYFFQQNASQLQLRNLTWKIHELLLSVCGMIFILKDVNAHKAHHLVAPFALT